MPTIPRKVSPMSQPLSRVGCAGWQIPAAHAGLFGPGDSVLARYATRFTVVEINSSFHRPHQATTYQRWANTVPEAFRFSVKLPKNITHEYRLHGSGSALDRFTDEIAGLGDKLGGVLVQLPPSLVYDARLADTFFAMLRRRVTVGIACEPRHASWFDAKASTLWARYQICRVAADPSSIDGQDKSAGDGPWRYWRWHGAPRMYYSAYDDDALGHLTREVAAVMAPGIAPWVIFDNTAHGHAVANAARLQDLLEPATPGTRRRSPPERASSSPS